MKWSAVILLAAACGSAAPAPRGPERDLEETPRKLDAGVAEAAQDASIGSGSGSGSAAGSGGVIAVASPAVEDAERTVTTLAADLRAAITAGRIEPASDLDPRCHALDRALDNLRPRVASTARAVGVVRASSAHAGPLLAALPIEELGAVLDTCRARKQIELPGIEAMIDDLEALVGADR